MFVLSLVLQPAMRMLERIHLPRGIAAMLMILVVFGTLGGVGAALSVPATSWAQKLPKGIPKLEERLSFLSSADCGLPKIHRSGARLNARQRTQGGTCDGAGLGALHPAA